MLQFLKNLFKKKQEIPQEILIELKKLPRKRRKSALELYKLYEQDKVINIKEEISKNG